ncbi:fused MFS/spermidine synthase [uncultured Brevundimonas sp.]|uniref:spermidine synthase n=1 Tax=uncultured Brevundimonas sp. TaxID=213418 RepID=UPI00261FE597|nr:fused MFS/spermidine synthase [uncultured Brevundimonas sp.]
MTDQTVAPTESPIAPRSFLTPALFAVAIFTSASLVFVVQPMVTKLILPMLGGSPAVWNTAMVFFQTALLAGYLYAHLLQRVPSVRLQTLIHVGILVVAALFLPLQIRTLLGEPDTTRPIFWLLGTLAVSIGAPFAVLSATAPLLQAWFAKAAAGTAAGRNPYVLYAASNLGSFLALLSYPILIEPLSALSDQRSAWSIGYGVFVTLVLLLLARLWNTANAQVPSSTASHERSAPIPWMRKLVLILLAAAPSSLMLGVTAHISTDVASAPFLWVIPLALYLLTFVIAFQTRPIIPLPFTLLLHAAAIVAVVATLRLAGSSWIFQFSLHLVAFFLTTLMCHQQLAARRPAPDRLTEFYLLMSIGGVVGGAFTALLAPVLFSSVIEYPLVLLLACLARSNSAVPVSKRDGIMMFAALAVAVALPLTFYLLRYAPDFVAMLGNDGLKRLSLGFLLVAGICAFLIRDRVLPFFAVLAVALMASYQVTGSTNYILTERSFFGVLRVSSTEENDLGGTVHTMMHGTTIHGAQALHPEVACRPLMYYARTTPLGQAALMMQERRPAIRMGVVGQGSGSMATYKRANDSLTFFEIDPVVDEVARNPAYYTYISRCAQGEVATVIGDARLTLQKQPKGSFDYLLIDAFSSDAIPTHLLTREAIASYATLLSDDGVLVLHLSNRHLDIVRPAMAAADAAGLSYLHQVYRSHPDAPDLSEATTEALVITKTPAALADFKADGRWSEWNPGNVKPWTDDYVDLFGAMLRDMRK